MKRFLLSAVLVGLMAGVSGASVAQRSFIFEYNIILKDIPSDASTVKVWVPSPPKMSYQKVEGVLEKSPVPHRITHDKNFNNEILLYSIDSPKDPSIEINTSYPIVRYEYLPKPLYVVKEKEAPTQAELEKYLRATRYVTLSPRIRKLAGDITKGKVSDLDKARAIYDYVFENLKYDKSIPGWGKGDSERACDLKAGNCTDFHSLFISLSRASGIPARFLIGVPLSESEKGQRKSYHCWAEFYAKDIGWVPVDISEAWKDKSKYEYHFGTIDEDRIEFTQGRDIILEEAHNKEPLNYFIFPYVEVDGKPFENIDVTFNYENIKKP